MKCSISLLVLLLQVVVHAQVSAPVHTLTIGSGQMPAVATGKNNEVHVVFGRGDSILYASSKDGGSSFGKPACIGRLPGLIAFATRGPQITVTKTGVAVVALDKEGDIFSYTKSASGKWTKGSRVNDRDTIAKEGFVSLSGDGDANLFAVWLDLRGNRRNKLYGAASADGGKTWGPNKLIYASPEGTVCECCKPSVAVAGRQVYVMFRNLLQGNRDLYMIRSNDDGKTFGQARKLGEGSWALDACPMDGGGIAIQANGGAQTVWRRKSTIYTCAVGQPEQAIGEGRSCVIASANGKDLYAWIENGSVKVLRPDNQKITLGPGISPAIAATGDGHALCVWEDERQIHSAVIGW